MYINYILLKCEGMYIKLLKVSDVTKIFKMILTKVIILTGFKILLKKKSKGLSRKRECLRFIFYHLINICQDNKIQWHILRSATVLKACFAVRLHVSDLSDQTTQLGRIGE